MKNLFSYIMQLNLCCINDIFSCVANINFPDSKVDTYVDMK